MSLLRGGCSVWRRKRGVTLPVGGRVRTPGVRASSQPVLRGSKEVSFVVSRDGRFSRTITAGIARIRANGSGGSAKLEIGEAETTCCIYRRPGRKYKYTNQNQGKCQPKPGPAEWGSQHVTSL